MDTLQLVKLCFSYLVKANFSAVHAATTKIMFSSKLVGTDPEITISLSELTHLVPTACTLDIHLIGLSTSVFWLPG